MFDDPAIPFDGAAVGFDGGGVPPSQGGGTGAFSWGVRRKRREPKAPKEAAIRNADVAVAVALLVLDP